MNKPGRLVLLLGASSVLTALMWLWWICRHSLDIHFLPQRAPADWIVYPNPPDSFLHYVADSCAEFRRPFDLASIPTNAVLRVCGFRNLTLTLNGRPLNLPESRPANWKTPMMFPLPEGFLRRGTNVLAVTVCASNGPPALWLALAGDGVKLNSDSSWQVSWAGAVWRPARLAARPMPIGPGHPLEHGEHPLHALANMWPVWGLFALTALGGWLTWRRTGFLAGTPAPPPSTDPTRTEGTASSPGHRLVRLARRLATSPQGWLLAGVALLWLGLFVNNLPLLPGAVGFDVDGHMDYIQYLLTRHRLPLPNEGWAMYHPPLYYFLSAVLLHVSGLSLADHAGISLVRTLGPAAALANIALISASLRRLFPGRAGMQFVGTILAAFLPAQFYLSHYVTNEVFSATLITASLSLCLRLMQTPKSSVLAYAGLGACLGAALLAKMTAVLALPFVIATAAYSAWKQCGSDAPAILRRLVALLIACLGVGGWHYGRIWWHFGTPWLGNWNPATGFNWWQDDGYRTAAYYLRFGQVFHAPFFSGLWSFGDGMYSTFWSDALYGAKCLTIARPPWNYEWMAAGILLALVPTALIALGTVAACSRVVSRPQPEWLLLLGFPAFGVFALLVQTLTMPSYAQVKAFYLLSASLPICALAALGWGWLARRGRLAAFVPGVALVLWGLISFGAFWISRHSPGAQLAQAILHIENRQPDQALICLATALKVDPPNPAARILLVQTLMEQNRLGEALAQSRAMLQSFPNDATACLDAAETAAANGQITNALDLARQGVQLAPDDPRGHLLLFRVLVMADRLSEAVLACREGLRLTPLEPELHLRLGTALAMQTEPAPDPANPPATTDARLHLRLAGRLASVSRNEETLRTVAWLLAAYPDARVRDGAAAVDFASRANKLGGGKVALDLGTLAAAYAEVGRFPEAIATIEEARALAADSGQKLLAQQYTELRETFRAGQAARMP